MPRTLMADLHGCRLAAAASVATAGQTWLLRPRRPPVQAEEIRVKGRWELSRNSTARSVRRRVAVGVALAVAGVALSGCSSEAVDQWRRAGLPEPATEETPLIGDLWVGTWIAALGVGLLVWGLILFASVA